MRMLGISVGCGLALVILVSVDYELSVQSWLTDIFYF